MPSAPDSMPLVVFKFGGSSVGTPDRFRTIVDIVQKTAPEAHVVAIVSALSNVTRDLSKALEAFTTHPAEQDAILRRLVETLRTRHREHAFAVLSRDAQTAYAERLTDRMERLRSVFERVQEDGFSPALRDAILAIGEQLSVPIATLALRDAGLASPCADATDLVVTDDTFGEANVDRDATAARLQAWHRDLPPEAVPVLAGFIGATPDGRTTTLGFEGSDYTAALAAQMLSAQCLTRYTDVDGLYSDDPSTNASARRLDTLSMETAFALTESGRLGMHPKTLRPLVQAGIPMQVRSIETPDAPGTCILPEGVNAEALIPSRPAPATQP